MLEIKKTWLTFYGLSDHDFPIKWMFRLRRSEGFSGWFPISPSSVLRAPSPSREKVFLRFIKLVDSATPGKPFVQNDMRVGWEWKKKQFIWVYRYQNARKDLLLFKSSNMNQSKIIACGINQKLVPAVSTAIANSININVPILRTSNWICRASTCKAFSVYKQSAKYQRNNSHCVNSQWG